MAHKRVGVRVPIKGEAILSDKDGVRITTCARDISSTGMGVLSPSIPIEPKEYQVELTTEEGKLIKFKATLVYKDNQKSGFQTSDIDTKNSHIINGLIQEFQSTQTFIEQIDRHDVLEQCYIDEEGNEVSVAFGADPDKRVGVRIPIKGKAVLLDKNGVRITTRTKDISSKGIGVSTPSTPLEHSKYRIDITTEDGKTITLKATLVYKDNQKSGFQTSDIDTKNLHIINGLIGEFQNTEKFIEQIDLHDVLEQSFIDEEGNEVSITFDINSDDS
ncbi:MAG: PilZ domain-containing protein, partial [Desulfocapsa sp.]|nr:PilZ domain-containing protein [Desulfocapsa sp.]